MVNRINDQIWTEAAKEPLPSWMEGVTQNDQDNLEAMWSQVQGKLASGLTKTQMRHLFRIAKDSGRSEIRTIVQQHRRHAQGHCVVCVYETWPCKKYSKSVIEDD